eukprot:4643854-Amphidinium_carterae.1
MEFRLVFPIYGGICLFAPPRRSKTTVVKFGWFQCRGDELMILEREVQYAMFELFRNTFVDVVLSVIRLFMVAICRVMRNLPNVLLQLASLLGYSLYLSVYNFVCLTSAEKVPWCALRAVPGIDHVNKILKR